MTPELKKRIITSILLFSMVIFCIFVHKYFFIIAIVIISYFAFGEITDIVCRVMHNVSNWKKLLFNLINILYAFGIFAISAIGLYLLNGPLFFLYILSICICSDIGGYIIGKNIAFFKKQIKKNLIKALVEIPL